MANAFAITITAVDKATATVKKVNESLGKLTRPVSMLRSSVSAFSKEAGLDKVGKSLVKVGRAAGDVGEQLMRIAAPLAAIGGVSSIAGVTALATEWAKLGFEISRTSQTIGVSTDTLQTLRGAAQLSGVSAEELTGGLKTLGDTMQDALYGRNQQALMIMNRLGIRMHHTASGAVDTSRAFTDLSGAISRVKNPQVQGLIARTFGLEAALPLLRQGPEAIAKLEQQVRRSGAIMSGPAVAAADRFQRSMLYLGLAAAGVRNSIGEKLLPVLSPLVDKFAEWLTVNRDWIALNVGQAAQGLADAFKQVDWKAVGTGLVSIGQGIKGVVDWLGGWKNAAEDLMIFMAGKWLAGVLAAILQAGAAFTAVSLRMGGSGALGAAAVARAAGPSAGIVAPLGAIGAGIGMTSSLNGQLQRADPQHAAAPWWSYLPGGDILWQHRALNRIFDGSGTGANASPAATPYSAPIPPATAATASPSGAGAAPGQASTLTIQIQTPRGTKAVGRWDGPEIAAVKIGESMPGVAP